jgi:hypothetical protein
MFFSKKTLSSSEYLELKKLYETLRIEIESLEIDLQLYKKKLLIKRGISQEDENEKYKNSVLLPE